MGKERILIIEDEESIQELLIYNFKKDGFSELKVCGCGEEGLRETAAFQPDLILLDLMLPGCDGLSVCRQLKANTRTANIPIIMLTAKSEEADIVVGLELGADDYITKPFSPKVLVARARSVLRRYGHDAEAAEEPGSAGALKRGPLTMNRGRRECMLAGEALTLTYSEFEILYYLASHPGWVFTRSQIVNAVKGDDYPVTERSIDVQIVALRRKLGSAGALIETVRGVGYRFQAE